MLKTKLFAAPMLAAALGLSTTANAGPAELKPHHKALGDCALCHTQENAVAGNAFVVPDNKACLACHGSWQDLAEKTKPTDPSPIRTSPTTTARTCPARPATPSTRKAA